ncbi:SDR family oxidoreductase [Actinomadura nitritigenes]|uniref:SDR family oxidoreductase n=2 Tax=Actinomadura nitritigenes TaxID=134602 RepID=UPI003D89CA30
MSRWTALSFALDRGQCGGMRISLITGANKGIGFEVARQLGGLGGQKVLVGARNEERGRKAAAALRAEGVDAGHVLVDVTDAAGLKRAAERIEREHGRLDALVNNAGIAILDWNLRPGRVPLDMVRRTYETNVVGVIAVTDAMLPLLRRSEAGRIVNVSSRLGSLAVMSDRESPVSRVNLLAYNSSKAALNAVTVAYAKELAETPIKVNSVNPGFCDTDMASDLIAAMGAGRGVRTPAEGARAAVTAATLPDDGPTGSFFGDEGPVPW